MKSCFILFVNLGAKTLFPMKLQITFMKIRMKKFH